MPNWDISRGFLYVCIIYIAGRIRTAVMAGEILFFSLAGPVGDYTGAHTVVFSRGFSIYYSPDGRAKVRWAGQGEHCIF
jgi:hypothetical protein